MSALDRHAEQIADILDRRWGLRDEQGLRDYLRRAIRDAAIEVMREAALPQEDDNADVLAGFLMRQNGVDESTAEIDTLVDFRQKAVHILDATEAAGIELGDLLALFVPEP